MKQTIPILVAALVGAAAMFVLKTGNSSRESGSTDTSKLEQQITDLRKQLNEAKAQADRVDVIETEREKIV